MVDGTKRGRVAATVALLVATMLTPGCGGGGGGGGGGPNPIDVQIQDPDEEFFLAGVQFARPIFAPDGRLLDLVNPASLHETDPLTNVVLPGFPKVLEPGTRAVRARVVWFQTGLTLVWPWTVSVDLVEWSLRTR